MLIFFWFSSPLPFCTVDARWFGADAAPASAFVVTCGGVALPGKRNLTLWTGKAGKDCAVRKGKRGGGRGARFLCLIDF